MFRFFLLCQRAHQWICYFSFLHHPVSGPPHSGNAVWVHLSQREAHKPSKEEAKHRYRTALYRRTKMQQLSSASKRTREEDYKRCPENHKRHGEPTERCMTIACPSAKKGKWTNPWKEVCTDTDTIVVFDKRPAGKSSGDLSPHVCTHLKYLLPYNFIMEFHLLKKNTLFHLHSKQVLQGKLKGQWKGGASMVQKRGKAGGINQTLPGSHSPRIPTIPAGTQGVGGTCPVMLHGRQEESLSS